MSRTVASLKDGVSGLLTGTNLDNVTNLNNALERALRTFLGKASIPEASTSQIYTLYDGIYNYLAPSNIFGGAVRDFRPLGISRNSEEYVYRQPIALFDRTKAMLPNGTQLTFETESGVNVMRIANGKVTPKIILDPMNATTGWSGIAGLSSITFTKDTTFYYQSPASLRLSGPVTATTATITKTLTNAVDLTSYVGVAKVFLALNLPALNLTSITLRLGSSSSNYYEVAATQGNLGAWTTGDFIETGFDLASATTTGTPVVTAINYIRFSMVSTGTLANMRIGYLWIALPSPNKLFYETTAIFQNSTSGALSNSIGADNDLILLNDSAYNIYEHECAITIGLQMGGNVAGGLVGNLNSLLNGARAKNGTVITLGLYDNYKANNPAEELRSVDSYYDV